MVTFYGPEGYNPMATLWTRWTITARAVPYGLFVHIYLNENIGISIQISLGYVPKGSNNQYSSVGSDNGLVPMNTPKIFWRGCAAPVFEGIPLGKEHFVENIPLTEDYFLILGPFLGNVKAF